MNRTQSTTYLGTLLALSVAAAACGDDEDKNDTSDSGTDAGMEDTGMEETGSETGMEDTGMEETGSETGMEDTGMDPGNIVEVAVAAGNFTTLVAAVQAADLDETLAGEGPFTVFAPTDEAFAALPDGTVEALLADPETLAGILLYHVVPGALGSGEVVAANRLTTAAGIDVEVTVEGEVVTVGGATVSVVDIEASNGVIHVIDSVILPPGDITEIASGNADFETLVTALSAAGLVDDLQGEGPFTVFAPTDAAFAALPAGALDSLLADTAALADVLTYHVVADRLYSEDVLAESALTMLNGDDAPIALVGGVPTIAGAEISVTDIIAANGVIHVLDAVMLPPADGPGTIVDVALGAGNFTTLVAALSAAGLDDDLAGEGPFTVFAPTDAAFAALPAGTVDALLADIPALTDILLYHVVSGELDATAVVGSSLLTTLSGIDAKVVVDGATVTIAGATISVTNVEASNGIIHIIDAVMLPPGDIVAVASANPDFETLVAAVTAAGLVDDLQGEGPFTVFAPTDDAFAALPAGTVDSLLADIPALTDILLFHVVSGRVPASVAVTLDNATMLNGDVADIMLSGTTLTIDGATVVVTDIPTSNGIIHVIDAVMLP